MAQLKPFNPDGPTTELATSEGQQVGTAMVTSRQAQEVQAAMVIAKRFPRDETAAYNRIINACKRPVLAEGAIYTYPKGGKQVTGPSIRLAETLAQCWGNLDCGLIELSRNEGDSEMMAYCWDLETNTRTTKIFTVRHIRDTKQGGKELTDERDIYEMTANQGSRRLRAAILAIIPGDVIDAALAQIDKTLKGQSTKPLADRIREMVTYFSGIGVTQEMLEKRLGHAMAATNETELVTLRGIATSLKDNMSKREDYFEVASTSTDPDEALKPGPSGPKGGAKKRQAPIAEPLPAQTGQPLPPSAAPEQQTAGQDMKDFFGNDITKHNPENDKMAANETDIARIKQIADLKLSAISQEAVTGPNRNKLVGFAAIGQVDGEHLNNPTRAEARLLATLVAGLSEADVKTAIEA